MIGTGHRPNNRKSRRLSTSLIDLQNVGTGGLTFFKDFRTGSSLNADYSVGSATATYTAARSASAPATYIDSNGIIQLLTTSDVRRRFGGYYNALGFTAQSGEMIEAAGTNLALQSEDFATTWIDGGVEVTGNQTTAPNNLVTADKVDEDTASSEHLFYQSIALTSGAVYTISIYAKSAERTWIRIAGFDTDAGKVWFDIGNGVVGSNNGVNSVVGSIEKAANGFYRCKVKFTSGGTVTGNVSFAVVTGDLAESYQGIAGMGVYFWGAQVEVSSYATSYIPTTTAALTRGAEVLKYVAADNRTGGTETIIMKVALNYNGTDLITTPILIDNQINPTDRRVLQPRNDIDKIRAWASVGSNSTADQTSSLARNVSYVVGMTSAPTGDPNATIYINGILEASGNTDFTTISFGTSFFVGCNYLSGEQADASIQAVAIYNRVLSAPEILAVTNIINGGF